jgi:catechol 2,3-dioxygenase-like lactoylglutathione lyase family enzyme
MWGRLKRHSDAAYHPAMAVEWDWERVVFDHVRINVESADESIRFYETVLGVLGIPPLWRSERGAQFANLVVIEDTPGGPIHLAFVAESRERVDAFHAAGLAAGFADNGPPGVREQYSSEEGGRYYAAFLLDPDS